MSEGDPHNEGFEAGLRWISEQIGRSIERLGELDPDEVARLIQADTDRAKDFLETAGEWLNAQAENFGAGTVPWFGGGGDPAPEPGARREGPHPLDVPTQDQGLALSALDSGRWTIEPGSHVIVGDEGPEPVDPVGLVGELRARDWVNADGEVTLVGRNALERWLNQGDQGGQADTA